MLSGKNSVDRRIAALLDLVRERRGLNFCLGQSMSDVRSSLSVDRKVAQQRMHDGAQGGDLNRELRPRKRAFDRHFISSFVRLAMTKVAARAGGVSAGAGSLAIARIFSGGPNPPKPLSPAGAKVGAAA